MVIGDSVLIRGTIIDYDSNPHGASMKIRVQGSQEPHIVNKMCEEFWIHRVDRPIVIIPLKQDKKKQKLN